MDIDALRQIILEGLQVLKVVGIVIVVFFVVTICCSFFISKIPTPKQGDDDR